MEKKQYIIRSIETGLFYLNILKEHTLLLSAAIPPKQTEMRMQLERYRNYFDMLLADTIKYVDALPRAVWDSGEMITSYTLDCGLALQQSTGIYVNRTATEKMVELSVADGGEATPFSYDDEAYAASKHGNAQAKTTAQGFKALKGKLFASVKKGELVFHQYPSVILHMIHEDDQFMRELDILAHDDFLTEEENLLFWTKQAKEHAMVLRGRIDPAEAETVAGADEFAEFFFDAEQDKAAKADIVKKGLIAFAEYCDKLTQSLLDHAVAADMPALLSDHIGREARRGAYDSGQT